ncbi:MAG: VOC family protein [Pseudomonadota bacterium]
MTVRTGIASLGEIMQIAFVPTDFGAAVAHWTQTMGVGPFFLMEGIHLEGMKYKGKPTDAHFDLALAYWGDLQVELIRPRDTHPSIYTGEYADGLGGGLHHTCLLVDDIGEAYIASEASGAEVLIEGSLGESRVIYVDPGPGAGSLVEILQPSPESPALFEMIKQAGIGWDGREPLRKLG